MSIEVIVVAKVPSQCDIVMQSFSGCEGHCVEISNTYVHPLKEELVGYYVLLFQYEWSHSIGCVVQPLVCVCVCVCVYLTYVHNVRH